MISSAFRFLRSTLDFFYGLEIIKPNNYYTLHESFPVQSFRSFYIDNTKRDQLYDIRNGPQFSSWIINDLLIEWSDVLF